MKAISIRQPWPWLIFHAGKDHENRTWKPNNPNLRFRGVALIHAGKELDDEAAVDVANGINPCTGEPLPPNLIIPDTFDCGGIVGIADFTDIVTRSASPWFVGPFAFVLRHAAPLPFVHCKGALGFFDVPDEIARELRS